MDALGDFIVILSIMLIVSFVIILGTIISVARSGSSLTDFEKKILIFVAVILCFFVIALYVLSNFELFKAIF